MIERVMVMMGAVTCHALEGVLDLYMRWFNHEVEAGSLVAFMFGQFITV